MPSILSTNMASLYAQRNLASAQAESAGSVQKLSSGRQINSARDNAAGLGISEGVMGVRNISDQSIRNLQSATSLVQTADGALDVVGKILQRALTLSTQKNETTLNAEQISVIDNEIASLISEIGRIKDRTRFNGGDSIFGETYSFGAGSGVTTTFTIPELGMPELGINFLARSIAVNSVTLDRSVQASVGAGSAVTGTTSGREVTTSLSAGTAVNGTSSGLQATATVSSSATPITGVNTPVVGTATISDTFNIAHTYTTGTELRYRSGSGNSIGGLVDGNSYYVIRVDGDSFKLASSSANATAGTAIDLTGVGSATDAYFIDVANPDSFAINAVGTAGATTSILQVTQDWSVNRVVFFERNTANASKIGTLSDTGVYIVGDRTSNSLSLTNYFTGVKLTFDSSVDLSGAKLISASNRSLLDSFGASNELNLAGHGFLGGEKIFYSGDTTGGLVKDTLYYVSTVTGTNATSRFKLASTYNDAINKTNLIDLTNNANPELGNFSWTPTNGGAFVTQFSVNPVLPPNTLVVQKADPADANLSVGQTVTYREGSEPIAGLTNNTQYTVSSSSNNAIQLSSSGTAVSITNSGDLTNARFERETRLVFNSGSNSIVNTRSNEVTSLTTHGFALGDAVYYNTSGVATTIGGLTNNTKYYAIPTSTTSFQLAASASAAAAGDEIALTSIGSGTQHFTFMPASNALQSSASHNFATGEAILYTRSGVGSSDIGGLVNNTTYYAIESTSNTFKLATTAANATAGTAITISSPGSGTQSFTPVSDVLSASAHGFSNTNPVLYSTTGTPIGGLTNNTTYYVRSRATNSFELATLSGGEKINLTSAGTGTHTFTYMPGTNALTINGHGFAANEPIVYSTTGTPIGGLTSGTTYYAIQDTANTFKLAAAANGAAITLTSPGTGTQSFTPVSDVLSANSHGFSNTNAVVYTTTGTPIGGLTSGTTYYARSVSANSFELAASPGGAKINLTSAGSGTQTFTYMPGTNAVTINSHGFAANEPIVYSTTGTPIGGLTSGTTYYAIQDTANTFKLAAAANGAAITLTSPGTGTQSFTPVSDVLSANSHGFSNTNAVVYTTTGTPIGGLTSGTTYYARSVSANSFELAASPGGAKINLTSAGSGTHSFMTDADSIRSTGHGLSTGDEITYDAGTGSAIGGLVDGTTYNVIRIDADSFNLAIDASAAQSATAINLTGTGNNTQTFATESGSISTASIVGAIAINSSNRAELGARLNTLSYAIDSLQTLSNNLSEAYSRIVDTDYAAETSNLTKNKILQEAATAMLAQANQMPNVILTLLK